MVTNAATQRNPTRLDSIPDLARSTSITQHWGFPEWFVVSQTILPSLLYLPGTQDLRIPIRVSAFGMSLAALLFWHTNREVREAPHPARRWLWLSLVCLAIMIFHPTTNTLLAGFAQVILYLSVMAPVFWAPSLIRGPRHLERLLAILLVCNGINATVGVMQVYDPNTWLPSELSSIVLNAGSGYVKSLTYIGADGRRLIRPPGLSDNPGAVCGPGMMAALLGLIFFQKWKNPLQKAIALAFAFIGVAAVYLSHVRTVLLILVGMLLVYAGINLLRGQKGKAFSFLGLSISLILAAFFFATMFGGDSIIKRFQTLIEDDPATVYYKAYRGEQLEQAFTTLLFDYPLGAGLGRWGMMRAYFGDPSNLNSSLIWAELQFPAWILDGGVILLVLYSIGLVVAANYEFRLAIRTNNSDLGFWATAIAAANAGTLALVFGFTPFTTQIGLQYWFLVGALYGAARYRSRLLG